MGHSGKNWSLLQNLEKLTSDCVLVVCFPVETIYIYISGVLNFAAQEKNETPSPFPQVLVVAWPEKLSFVYFVYIQD